MRLPVRRLSAAAAAIPLAAGFLFATAGPAGAATTIIPTDDAYVRSDLPSSNFGTATSIQARTSPVYNGYLKFTVSGLASPVTRATLKLFSRSTGTTPVSVSTVADTTWSENTITYATAPPIGSRIGGTGALTAGTWASVDVSSTVLGNGTYSFALTSPATAARVFDSKEGVNPPQLVLQTSSDPTVVATGDVACSPSDPGYNGGAGTPGHCHEMTTASLIGAINPTALFMLGDGQYNAGSLTDYDTSYDPSWGRFKAITSPVVGNHDYGTTGAGGYFSYFGSAATPLQPSCTSGCNGYYSFNVGAWHIVVLNTECAQLNGGAGCAVGSPEELWLKSDLAAHPNLCTMVIGHRPRWSSNSFASADIAPLIDDMYAAGVDLYVTGHAHSYERFSPQNPSGGLDTAKGIRQFVIGTGGAFYTGFGTIVPNSQVHKASIFGVMRFTLHSGSYSWSYAADPSTPFSDSGSGSCH
jgi:hypothetical protein